MEATADGRSVVGRPSPLLHVVVVRADGTRIFEQDRVGGPAHAPEEPLALHGYAVLNELLQATDADEFLRELGLGDIPLPLLRRALRATTLPKLFERRSLRLVRPSNSSGPAPCRPRAGR